MLPNQLATMNVVIITPVAPRLVVILVRSLHSNMFYKYWYNYLISTSGII